MKKIKKTNKVKSKENLFKKILKNQISFDFRIDTNKDYEHLQLCFN